MEEEQCDLDALAAILDDDSNDFVDAEVSQTDTTRSQSETRRDMCAVNGEMPSGNKLNNGKVEESDEQCDHDTLTSFLEQNSSDDEDLEPSIPVVSEKTSKVETGDLSQHDIEAFLNEPESESESEEDMKEEIKADVKSTNINNSKDSDTEKNNQNLQAELLMMQKRMKELEDKLKASQTKEQEPDINHFFGEDKEKPAKSRKTKSPPIAKPPVPVHVTPIERKEMEKNIFGDSDDSDWDELDGEKSRLSKEGQELKKLVISGERKREAHQPFSGYSDYTSTKTWKSKSPTTQTMKSPPSQKPTVPSNNRISTTKSTTPVNPKDDGKFIMEKNSGIRIINPLTSSTVLEMKMEGRKFIKISKIHQKVKTGELQGDWVTFGVVVHKTDPKTASSGKTFCIWKLNDLDDCDRTVSFFLFGQVYKDHWKNSVGSVIGLLNPNMMDAADKAPAEVAFTITHPNQLLLMGQSKDLAWCMGKTKKGNKCTNFINNKFGGFCSFHVQSAYKSASSKRSEFQGSMTGVTPKSFEKKIFPKGSHYMYGGKTFSSMELKSTAKKKQDQLTVRKLMTQQTKSGKQKVTTMSIHELKPQEKDHIEQHLVSSTEQSFMELVTTPSAGSMNLVKHLVKTEIKEAEEKQNAPVQSITPKELLQQHRKKMLAKKTERLASLNKPSPPTDPLSATPTLGRGFYPGQHVFLDTSKKTSSNSSIDKAKLLAIAKVSSKGGCKKENPNAVKKVSPVHNRVKKRVLENIESNDVGASTDTEPPKKRSKLLGNVDINSPEVQKLLKAKSSHMGAYKEAEAEREEKYFDLLEKKETMEEKMKSITEMACTVFTCKQCKYSALSLARKCKEERHAVTSTKAKKRFFECKKCKQRTVDFHKFPTKPCGSCGEYCFERTSMYKEKAGPKLDSEKLCIRGDEIKNLNSLNEKVYL
ncbi:protein MCM10 homolog [Patella vulgata]|uniref:protein MCM10 homolog n=1 Tax=Patella vulgata TaxID=6465 RepID=UPI00217FA670|nr:protein MCM10 homolog [Patella vulgata]